GEEWRLAFVDEDRGAGCALQLAQGSAVVEVVVRDYDLVNIARLNPEGPQLAQDDASIPGRASVDQGHSIADQCENLAAEPPELMDAGHDLHQSTLEPSAPVVTGDSASRSPGGSAGSSSSGGAFTVGRTTIAATTITAITAKMMRGP